MSENVSLLKKKQKGFNKRLSKIKKQVEIGTLKVKENVTRPVRRRFNRGVIYLGHIPHGFYEEQMRDYFNQFGRVTNVVHCRSEKTNKSKGFGFVQFTSPDVAKIAAETMDNYLMFKRRLIAKYIPPEKQTLKMHKQNFWHSNSHKKFLKRREKLNKMKNADVDDEKYIKSTKKTLSKLNKKQKKLEELGVNIQFKPVDVPEELKTEKSTKKLKKSKKDKEEYKFVTDPDDSDIEISVSTSKQSDKTELIGKIPKRAKIKSSAKKVSVSPKTSAKKLKATQKTKSEKSFLKVVKKKKVALKLKNPLKNSKGEKSPLNVKAEMNSVKNNKHEECPPISKRSSPRVKMNTEDEKNPIKPEIIPLRSRKSSLKAKRNLLKMKKSPLKVKKSPLKPKKSPLKTKKGTLKATRSLLKNNEGEGSPLKTVKTKKNAATPPENKKKAKTSVGSPKKNSPKKNLASSTDKKVATPKKELVKLKPKKKNSFGLKIVKGVQKKSKDTKKKIKGDLMKLAFREMMKGDDKEKIITRSSSISTKGHKKRSVKNN